MRRKKNASSPEAAKVAPRIPRYVGVRKPRRRTQRFSPLFHSAVIPAASEQSVLRRAIERIHNPPYGAILFDGVRRQREKKKTSSISEEEYRENVIVPRFVRGRSSTNLTTICDDLSASFSPVRVRAHRFLRLFMCCAVHADGIMLLTDQHGEIH